MDVKAEYEKRRAEFDRLSAENDLMERKVSENEQKIFAVMMDLDTGQQALKFLEEVANARRGAMKSRIGDVLTEALQLLYGKDYKVDLTYTVKNNRSHMLIEMVREIPEGEVRRDPTVGAGGGVELVAKFLRVLTERLGIQVILCTHHRELQPFADRAFFLKEVAGKTEVEEL